jgi:hypothetical protein
MVTVPAALLSVWTTDGRTSSHLCEPRRLRPTELPWAVSPPTTSRNSSRGRRCGLQARTHVRALSKSDAMSPQRSARISPRRIPVAAAIEAGISSDVPAATCRSRLRSSASTVTGSARRARVPHRAGHVSGDAAALTDHSSVDRFPGRRSCLTGHAGENSSGASVTSPERPSGLAKRISQFRSPEETTAEGALMEPTGCIRWQLVANVNAPERVPAYSCLK